jgi:hypothetical protein
MGGPVDITHFHHQPETILILAKSLQGLASQLSNGGAGIQFCIQSVAG